MNFVVGLIFLFLFSLTCLPEAYPDCATRDCHPAIGKIAFPHQPVALGECLSCHDRILDAHPIKGEKSFRLVVEGGGLCRQCHEVAGKEKFVHSPALDGDCIACHQPHGGGGRFLLDAGDDRRRLCFSCHDDTSFRQRYLHGPAAVGACSECHVPHAGNERWLLKSSVRDLCDKCHKDFALQMKEAAFVHPPVKNDPCTSCHTPHASSVPFLLAKKMPGLCTDCHREMGKKLAEVKTPHQPLADPKSCGSCHSTHFSAAGGLLAADEKTVCLGCHGAGDVGDVGKPPLRNIEKELAGRKTLHGPLREDRCSPCHDPHGSNSYRMLTGRYPANLYVRYQEGSYDFCLQCHNKYLLQFAETTLYTGFRNGNRNLHFVHVVNKKKGRSCGFCHQVHASDGPKLIGSEGSRFGDWKIPVGFKTTPTGGSCTPGCHRPLQYDREGPVQSPTSPGR